jgi:hypothetical protein
MSQYIKALFLFLCLPSFAFAICIPVAGLQFERISSGELLASKNGINFAILGISLCPFCGQGGLPAKITQFRFFTEHLCTEGAESRFHIDGNLYYLFNVTYFKN